MGCETCPTATCFSHISHELRKGKRIENTHAALPTFSFFTTNTTHLQDVIRYAAGQYRNSRTAVPPRTYIASSSCFQIQYHILYNRCKQKSSILSINSHTPLAVKTLLTRSAVPVAKRSIRINELTGSLIYHRSYAASLISIV